jgi:hypothetical protein
VILVALTNQPARELNRFRNQNCWYFWWYKNFPHWIIHITTIVCARFSTPLANRVFAAPDDPVAIEEASALSLVILGPALPHAGKGVGRTPATDAIADTLMRRGASQRRLRNTLIFIAADEANLSTARDVMRKAIAWASIYKDGRLKETMTTGQTNDAEEKAKTNLEAARKAVRAAWSHIFYPVKSEAAGKPFDLEHSLISARERVAIPAVVYDKVKADGIALEKLGAERLWLALEPLWPEDRPHLPVSQIADWFAAYVYLPKIRDRVVLATAIRDSVAKIDPQFALAESYDAATQKYHKLTWEKVAPEIIAPTALLVRAAEVQKQIQDEVAGGPVSAPTGAGGSPDATSVRPLSPGEAAPSAPRKPTRFYGSVEIDMVRPVKSFDAILSAVVMELQRTNGAKIKLTLEIEAEAVEGFDDSEVSVVRDNARQLKFKAESTGFGE